MQRDTPAERTSSARVAWRWIYDGRTDGLIAWCWLPVFALVHVLTGRTGPGADDAVLTALTVALLASLLHQPLTLLLVHGDGTQFRQHRRLFLPAPPPAL